MEDNTENIANTCEEYILKKLYSTEEELQIATQEFIELQNKYELLEEQYVRLKKEYDKLRVLLRYYKCEEEQSSLE